MSKTYIKMEKLSFLFFSRIIASDAHQPKYLEHALKASDANRLKQERVLTFCKGDSLMYKSDVFLIEYMYRLMKK
jgi:hypothetical protein